MKGKYTVCLHKHKLYKLDLFKMKKKMLIFLFNVLGFFECFGFVGFFFRDVSALRSRAEEIQIHPYNAYIGCMN